MEKNSDPDVVGHLKLHLSGKAVVLGIGNTLRSDDGVGALLAGGIMGKVPFIVYDGSSSPENYLGKIIKDRPDNILLVDAVDFGGRPGEFTVLEGENMEDVSFFSTHDASISLAIDYLKKSLPKTGILVLAIQPKSIAFGDSLSPEIENTLNKLREWFIHGQDSR